MKLKKIVLIVIFSAVIWACKEDAKVDDLEHLAAVEKEENIEFGFNLDNFIVKRDTIKSGDSFGEILERNNIGYPKIFQIAEKAKDTFDIRKLQIGKPYTLLCAKDSLQTPKSFIYQPSKEEYVVIDFQDSIQAYLGRKPIKYVEKEASGIITPGSGISLVLDKKGLSQRLANKMANEIYAWTIDFNRLQPGDRFKVIYTDKYIQDIGDVDGDNNDDLLTLSIDVQTSSIQPVSMIYEGSSLSGDNIRLSTTTSWNSDDYGNNFACDEISPQWLVIHYLSP